MSHLSNFSCRAEKEDVSGLSDRRQEEIERLHARIGELSEELKRAVTAKCEVSSLDQVFRNLYLWNMYIRIQQQTITI